jgi:hypothetical protein
MHNFIFGGDENYFFDYGNKSSGFSIKMRTTNT